MASMAAQTAQSAQPGLRRRVTAGGAGLCLLMAPLATLAQSQAPGAAPARTQGAADTGTGAGTGTGTEKTLGVVTIIANPQDPQSTMGSAYTLTDDELRKFESTNVNEVLRAVPGVYVREEDGLGTFPNIGIRAGSSGRSGRLSLMEDGIPAAMSPYGNTSAYYFPSIGRMSGVEILKGPEVLFYGPQTTSGAINLLSTPIPDQASGSLKAEIGQYGTRNLHANYGATLGQWGFLAETFQRDTDGFHRIDRSKYTGGTDVEEYLLKGRWRSDAGARFRQQVDVRLFSGQEDADVSYLGLSDADFRANPDRRYGLGELERMDRARKSASIRHQIELSQRSLLTSTAYWVDTQRHYNRLNQINGVGIGQVANTVNAGGADAGLLQGILDGRADTTHANGVRYGHNHQDFVAKGLQFELLNSFETGSVQHEVTTGLRWHHDSTRSGSQGIGNSIYRQINGSLVYDSTSTVTPSRGEAEALAFWLADRITIGRLALLPILRHERIRSQANLALPKDDLNSNAINKTTAGLGVNYGLTPNWTVLAGYHKGFAPPGSGAVMGTRGEESNNLEFGARYREGSLGVDLIGFYSDYTNAMRNCLVANPCPGGAVEGTQQTGSKDVYGLEVGVFADLYRSGGHRVPLRFAYTYGEYTRDSDLAAGVRKGDAIEFAPKHMASLQVGWETTSGWRSYASLSYVSSFCVTNTCDRAGTDTRFLKTQSLYLVGLSTSYQLTRDVQVYAKLDNLLDEQRITNRSPDGARGNMGRYVGTGLRITF